MSRNLSRTDCRLCTCAVKITGLPMVYNPPNGHTVIFAHAECVACKAKYSAWLHEPDYKGSTVHREDPTGTFYDLSFRSTFNDESGIDDVPYRLQEDPIVRAVVTVHKIVRIDGVQVHEEEMS